jgi:hypothetical protein
LNVGSGSYWLFPTYDWSISGKDGYGSYKGQHGRSFLGSKIRQYDHPLPYSLHYTNRPYLFDELITGDKLLAYQRPSLEIMKDNLGFPGHRFITGYKLENDFVHPDYVAKPWYDESGDLNVDIFRYGILFHAIPSSFSCSYLHAYCICLFCDNKASYSFNYDDNC